MKIGKDSIREALLQSLMNGELKELEEFLSTSMGQTNDDNISEELFLNKKESEAALLDRFDELQRMKSLLEKPEALNTIGEYINIYLRYKNIAYSEFERLSGISSNVIHQLQLSPSNDLFNISPKIVAQVCKAIELSASMAIILLKKTIILAQVGDATSLTMARHPSKGDEDKKSRSMQNGARELLLKAAIKKPFQKQLETSSVNKIENYLKEFTAAYAKL